MAFLGPNNALAWAHYRLRGGWQRTLTFTIGAMIVLIMLIVGAVYSNPLARSRTLYGWTSGLLWFQGAIVTFYVMSRISTAVRQDIQGKIIESHRLMPTPPAHAIAGYISGGAMQPLVFSAAIFIVGIFTSVAAGMEISRWIFAHAILLAFAAFLWTVTAYASFGARIGGPALVFVPLFIAPYAVQGGGLSALPGLMVLLSPIVGDSIFDLRTSGIDLPATYAMALAAQACFGTIFFIAAARRYRSADSVGIDTTLGLLLVAGWTAITCLAMNAWDDFRPRGWRLTEMSDDARIISSLVAGMLIALCPIAAAAWARTRWRRHELLHDPTPMRRPLHPLLAIAIAVALILLIPFARPIAAAPNWNDVAQSAAVIAIALAGVYFVCAWVYFGYPRAVIIGFIWILLTWATPVIISLIRFGLADHGEAEPIDGIATASPIGALIVIWSDMTTDVRPGIVLQLLVICIPLVLRMMQLMRQRAAIARAA